MDFIKKCHPYQWRVYPLLGGFNNAQRKFELKINGAVHVRPKSAKEIGYTGRITSINTKAKSTTHAYSATELHVSQKKRKLTEDMRVTIQQHCYHHTEKYEDCITCHSTKHDVRPSRLVPVYDLHLKNNKIDKDADSLVLLTPDTTTYRQLATSHLRPNDYVLEIGCSTGECTALLLRRNLLLQSQNLRQVEQHKNTAANVVQGNIVGFDTGAKILKQADNRLRREYNQSASTLATDDDAYSKLIQLHRIDALADPKGAYALATSNNTCPGMVLIDIGGNRQLESVVRMIQWVQTAFKDERPRLILVKSEALENELSTALLSSHTNDNTDFSVPSVTDEGTITNGQNWFNSLLLLASPSVAADNEADKSLSRQQLLSRYSHPKKVPLVLSPKGTPICRYHNYHPDGCTKFNKSKSTGTAADEDEDDLQCQYDHEYCHWCQDAGHIAVNCPSLK
eukprot:scaffold349_cov157-Skeletonema_dohrnii-CCMP3373.AAC.4